MSKKKIQNKIRAPKREPHEKSRWTLEAEITEEKNGSMRVSLRTEPIPEGQDWDTEDPHPFSRVGEQSIECVRDGTFSEYVADNEVTRSIVKLLNDENLLYNSSGTTDWRWYRMNLIQMLDGLWD